VLSQNETAKDFERISIERSCMSESAELHLGEWQASLLGIRSPQREIRRESTRCVVPNLPASRRLTPLGVAWWPTRKDLAVGESVPHNPSWACQPSCHFGVFADRYPLLIFVCVGRRREPMATYSTSVSRSYESSNCPTRVTNAAIKSCSWCEGGLGKR
jgi:hypothetical protein